MQNQRSRSIVNALGFTMIILSLGGCSLLSSPKPQVIEISSKPVEKPQLVLPRADEINLRDIKWVILTPENFDEQVAKISKDGRPVAFFSLTDKGYESLGMNLSDLRAYIQQQQAIIDGYKAYYVEAEEALEGAVKED